MLNPNQISILYLGRNVDYSLAGYTMLKNIGFKLFKQDDKYENIDILVSFGYQRKIKSQLLRLPRIAAINFHPAPLPRFRGMAGVYNIGLLEKMEYWEVTAHYITESIDTGDIIDVIRFSIDPKQETVNSLVQKSHDFLLVLLKKVLTCILEEHPLSRIPQNKGRYISKQYFEKAREIHANDSTETIKRKIRAFWYPPHGGAYINIKGQKFTLVDENILQEIGQFYNGLKK